METKYSFVKSTRLPKSGKMQVEGVSPKGLLKITKFGDPEVGDVASVCVADKVELYVRVDVNDGEMIFGEIDTIGSAPMTSYGEFSVGQKVRFKKQFVHCRFIG